MEKTLKILKVFLSIYLVFCFIACAFWVYYKFFRPDTFTNSVIYANEVEDINGKKSFMEINSYNNLFEIKFNYYTDYDSTDVISCGVQILNYDELSSRKFNYNTSITGLFYNSVYFSYMADTCGTKNLSNKNLCFYEESDNISFKAVSNELNEFGCFKIEIDGVSYALQLGRLSGGTRRFITYYDQKSSLSQLIKSMYEVYNEGIQDIGVHYQTFPFKDLFDVYKFNGKEYEQIDSDIFETYIYTKVTNYNVDAKTAKDSIFGQIQYNSNWTNGDGESLLDEYFSDTSLFKLTEQNCRFEYDSNTNNHIACINEKTYNEYKDKNLNYALVFDLDYLENIGVVFGGVKNDEYLQMLNITSYYTLSNGILTEVVINV